MSAISELTIAAPSLAKSTWLGQAAAGVGALVSLVYLANIGFGFAEFSPDNIPLAGNIDEFLFSLLLVYCLQKLGINLLPALPGRRTGS